MVDVSRRQLMIGAAGAVGVAAWGGLSGCGRVGSPVGPLSAPVRRVDATRRTAGQKVVTARLTARPMTVDLAGTPAPTWGYNDSVPGPLLRAQAGDLLRVQVDNRLLADTSVHWHGLAVRNDMDGVPGMTQDPIASGDTFTYEFTASHPGTYFYHPHSGLQLDRGLYGALIVDDPAEPGRYDHEWVVVLDDWIDGTGRTPDQVLAELQSNNVSGDGGGGSTGGMGGGSMGGMGMGGSQSALLGDAGDVDYPHYLVNGHPPAAPTMFTAKPGQRVRVRIINAGTDTAFRVALGDHRLSVTHSDGFAVQPTTTDALLIGMGERYDVTVTVGDGVFPLVATAEGKTGQALAVVRTAAGPTPPRDAHPGELNGSLLIGTDLTAPEQQRLPDQKVDRRHDLVLAGTMAPYRWTINGRIFPAAEPLPVRQGERVRLRFQNRSMMFHPMHVHGHTFGLVNGGARKDTVIVRPMQTLDVDLDADNPGQWATHCHNIYHAEAGMMTTLSYRE